MQGRNVISFAAALCFVCLLFSGAVFSQDQTVYVADHETKARAEKLFAQGVTYSKEKKFDLAIETYREHIKIVPTAAAYHNLGASLGSTQRLQEALEAFQMAVKISPQNAVYHASLGAAYMNLRRWDESLAALNEAVRLDPDRAETYNTLGFLFDNTRRFEDALAANKKAVELAPDQPAAFHNLGLTYMKLGKATEAAEVLEKAVKMNPSYKNAWFHLSNTYSRLKRYREAVDSFTKLLALDPDNAELIVLRSWNYMYLGNSGREAAADAERFLKLYGWRTESSPFQVIIAVIGHRSVGSDDKAAAVLAQAQKKADSNVWPYKIIQFLGGQMTADELLAAAVNNDHRTEARTYIGMDLRLKNKPAEARTHFEWVKEYGNRSFYEYPLALAELERKQ